MRFLVCAAITGIELVAVGAAWGADLASDLVGYWKLDETGIAATTVAADSSPTRANGVYVNTPASDTAVPVVGYADPGSVLVSRASMQAVRVQAVPAALKPAAVTLAAWFRVRNTVTNQGSGRGYSDIVSVGDQTLIRVYADQLEASKRVAGNTWAPLRQAAVPGNGVWHHLAATIDGAGVRLYLDGAQVATLADTRPILYDLGADLWIGRHGSGTMGRDFDGNIDEVAIWARVLPAADVMALAGGQQPGTTTMVPPADAGVPPPVDAGAPPPVDAGAMPDLRTPPDPGTPDAGVRAPDPGMMADSGAPLPSEDARSTPVDVGVAFVDAPPSRDEGTALADARPSVDDAGAVPDLPVAVEDGGFADVLAVVVGDGAAPPADAAAGDGVDQANRYRADGSRPPAPAAGSGCGCATVPAGSGGAVLVIALAVMLTVVRTRRGRAFRRARRP